MKLHPIHEQYLTCLVGNTVERLLVLLDNLHPAKKRDEAVFLVAMQILKPRTRRPTSVHDRLEDLHEEHVSYSRLKERLRDLATTTPEQLLVSGVVQMILCYICNHAYADVKAVRQANQGLAIRVRSQLVNAEEDWEKAQLQQLIQMAEEKIQSITSDVAEAQAFYTSFCENVLKGLLEESEERAEHATNQFRELSEGLSNDPFPGTPKEPDE